jgi:hypothetical protein
MPKVPLHALIWSKDRNCYELYTHGQLAQRFRPGDDEAWLSWLAAQTAVAFHGAALGMPTKRPARAPSSAISGGRPI